MSNQFIGEIRMFSFGFPPKGWAFCNGALLPINQYQPLFALLGTTYGGDGETNFALPNMRGSVPIHQGQAAGLSSYTMGDIGGSEAVALSISQLPTHSHTFEVTTANATAAAIASNVVLAAPTVTNASAYAVSQAPDPPLTPAALAAGTLTAMGSGQLHSNIMPYLCINFCIALDGIFPSRN